jgi:hypothetical protein
MNRRLMLALVPFLIAGGTSLWLNSDVRAAPLTAGSTNTVVSVSDITWEKLNPARGDESPQAATLWGDRNGTVPTGFLAKFVDGFSSPPHIHNATYRAVVISGLIHNDDPGAEDMWMPPGSFWTQPEGQVHITAAKGDYNLALVEIDMGPYLVLPPAEAFDSGERPVNIDASNIVWVEANKMGPSRSTPKIAYLWGKQREGQPNGTFVKLPEGFVGEIRALGSIFRAVVITGDLQYFGATNQALPPGSYFSSNDESLHQIASGENEVTLYVRTNGEFEVKAQDP